METEAEMGGTQPPAQGRLGPPELEEAGRPLPGASERAQPCSQTPGPQTPGLQDPHWVLLPNSAGASYSFPRGKLSCIAIKELC